MESNEAGPKTLVEAIRHFADPEVALNFMVSIRWPEGIICPRCAATEHSFLSTRRIWKCKGCKRQFSVKVGTLFEDSPIGLDKWLPCLWLIVNAKNGISSYEVARALGVTQKTAWFMLHRIRLAMQTKTFDKFGGEVEVDETFIGGRARFMHHECRKRVITGTGGAGKTAVMGLLERHSDESHSRVSVSVIKNTRRKSLQPKVRESVREGSALYTDALRSYVGLDDAFEHAVIDHSEAYVKGKIHTNSMENFWSLLKRTLKGTYVSVEPSHLFRYLDEQAFRFNNRIGDDSMRFLWPRERSSESASYAALTGAALPKTC